MLCCFFQRKISFADPNWIARYSDFNITQNGKGSQLINRYKISSFRISRLMVLLWIFWKYILKLKCTMVLSRGRPLFLTQIEWDLTLIITSHIKARKVSSFGHYMYSEYIRAVQIEKERIWIFNAETCPLNVHP